MRKDYQKIILEIKNWIQKILETSNTKGFVYGVSGGIDSALICAIASKYFKDNSLAIRMDIFNQKNDVQEANLVIEHFKVKNIDHNLEKVYETFIENLPDNKLAKMNLKSRLRMNLLYYYAQVNNYLVCGTSNACELYTGYFTKYGDSGSDFMPLVNLTKSDVYECAKILNVPQVIIEKKPSAGLYENQTDESDLQVTYKEIDAFLENKKIDENSENRIKQLHKISNHKRNFPLTPKPIGELFN